MKIGLALGSGSARGFSHIGIISALEEMGIVPDIVCGSSIGAVIGAAYCSHTLDEVAGWVNSLDRSKIISYFDINWLGRGGPIKGEQMMDFLRKYIPEKTFSDLDLPFGTVATDMETGEDVWLDEGSILDAVRASSALPGILPPWPRKHIDGKTQWLVDGGLVDPVPVSLCRAMGADVVIAVNLNEYLVHHPEEKDGSEKDEKRSKQKEANSATSGSLLEKVPLIEKLPPAISSSIQGLLVHGPREPSYLTVVVNSIKIMQHRIAHVRLKENPPDVLLTPRLGDINMLAFERSAEAIREGRSTVERARDELKQFSRQKAA